MPNFKKSGNLGREWTRARLEDLLGGGEGKKNPKGLILKKKGTRMAVDGDD